MIPARAPEYREVRWVPNHLLLPLCYRRWMAWSFVFMGWRVFLYVVFRVYRNSNPFVDVLSVSPPPPPPADRVTTDSSDSCVPPTSWLWPSLFHMEARSLPSARYFTPFLLFDRRASLEEPAFSGAGGCLLAPRHGGRILNAPPPSLPTKLSTLISFRRCGPLLWSVWTVRFSRG